MPNTSQFKIKNNLSKDSFHKQSTKQNTLDTSDVDRPLRLQNQSVIKMDENENKSEDHKFKEGTINTTDESHDTDD